MTQLLPEEVKIAKEYKLSKLLTKDTPYEYFYRVLCITVDWDYISRNQKLSEAFIERYANNVDWFWISEYQKLSEAFIEKYANKVDWLCISECQKLSTKFRKKWKEKL